MNVRTRFAPSPTGFLHVGGLRTALFNWLFARHHGGKFLLRIEDTDQERYQPDSVAQIIEALQWAGLQYDEGPEKGGPHEPYVQSERLALYKTHAQMLVDKGKLYRCFCTRERLESVRQAQTQKKQPTHYDRYCRSLTMQESEKRAQAGEPFVLRCKLPEEGTIVVHDMIRGDVTFRYDLLDDSVVMKSDGYPTYHLAVVIDDHSMGITHVLRAEEWLPSTPKHIFLYDAFGWELPHFAHLPVILSPNKGKLSKRDGAVSVLDYREEGFLPETLINFLALLGWNPKNEREEFTREELVKAFRIEDVQKAGAVFDKKKLASMNAKRIRTLTPDAILTSAGEKGKTIMKEFGDQAIDVIQLVQDRMVTVNDCVPLTRFLVDAPPYKPADVIPKGGTKERTEKILNFLFEYYTTLDDSDYTPVAIQEKTLAFLRLHNWTNAEALWPLRFAVSGSKNSPGVFSIIGILKKQKTLHRLRAALKALTPNIA